VDERYYFMFIDYKNLTWGFVGLVDYLVVNMHTPFKLWTDPSYQMSWDVWVVVTTDADSSGNGTSCPIHHLILGTTLPKFLLFTLFMSPIPPPASLGRALEKGERLGDDAPASLVVAWTENSEFYLSKLRRSLRNSPSITLDDIDKLD
jgi:hypothetical protein